MACCPLPLNESFAQVRNDEMRRTTPAKPAKPAEPAPPLLQTIKGQHAPGANSEPLLPIKKAM